MRELATRCAEYHTESSSRQEEILIRSDARDRVHGDAVRGRACHRVTFVSYAGSFDRGTVSEQDDRVEAKGELTR
jgi:hypothetical protein